MSNFTQVRLSRIARLVSLAFHFERRATAMLVRPAFPELILAFLRDFFEMLKDFSFLFRPNFLRDLIREDGLRCKRFMSKNFYAIS